MSSTSRIESAIDIGTNTMLMLTAKVCLSSKPEQTRTIEKVLDDRINFVRLGQGVHQNRRFAPEAMERALKCFHEYRKICDMNRVDIIRAVGTSASRDSSNAREFYSKVKSETGINVEIIDGPTEARLSFLGGLLPNLDPRQSAILDIGGGSTEFVTLSPGRTDPVGQSLNVGSVRLTEMFLKGDPYIEDSLDAMELYLSKVWSELSPNLCDELRSKSWVGIAGTPTTLAGLDLNLDSFISEKVDGYKMTWDQIDYWQKKLASQTQKQRASNPIMGTGRADVMVAGVAILSSSMKFFGKKEIIVSSRGLRHGLLLN